MNNKNNGNNNNNNQDFTIAVNGFDIKVTVAQGGKGTGKKAAAKVGLIPPCCRVLSGLSGSLLT